MSFTFRCQLCRQKLAGTKRLQGKSIICPKCSGEIQVPFFMGAAAPTPDSTHEKASKFDAGVAENSTKESGPVTSGFTNDVKTFSNDFEPQNTEHPVFDPKPDNVSTPTEDGVIVSSGVARPHRMLPNNPQSDAGAATKQNKLFSRKAKQKKAIHDPEQLGPVLFELKKFPNVSILFTGAGPTVLLWLLTPFLLIASCGVANYVPLLLLVFSDSMLKAILLLALTLVVGVLLIGGFIFLVWKLMKLNDELHIVVREKGLDIVYHHLLIPRLSHALVPFDQITEIAGGDETKMLKSGLYSFMSIVRPFTMRIARDSARSRTMVIKRRLGEQIDLHLIVRCYLKTEVGRLLHELRKRNPRLPIKFRMP